MPYARSWPICFVLLVFGPDWFINDDSNRRRRVLNRENGKALPCRPHRILFAANARCLWNNFCDDKMEITKDFVFCWLCSLFRFSLLSTVFLIFFCFLHCIIDTCVCIWVYDTFLTFLNAYRLQHVEYIYLVPFNLRNRVSNTLHGLWKLLYLRIDLWLSRTILDSHLQKVSNNRITSHQITQTEHCSFFSRHSNSTLVHMICMLNHDAHTLPCTSYKHNSGM